jgi:tRNA A-37 threonylcarbamoyl transferase component Bud32
MAEVFRAHDELLARDVAVKVFRTPLATADPGSGEERQRIELQALARLNHPNLITLFDGSVAGVDGSAFLVMELVNGPSLAASVAQGPVPEPAVREIGIQIADALAYVHAEGMVHRDVKPANILLGTDRSAGDMTVRARLSDFGIVRLLGSERLTSVDYTLGTASYLAPEQARGADVGPVADVYSLGLVLIEALTGIRSYDGPALEAVLARLDHGPEVPEHLPPPWPALLASMTALDPDERPSAEQVAAMLRTGSAPSAVSSPAAQAAAAAGAVAAVGAADAAEAGSIAAGDTVGLAALGLPVTGAIRTGADPEQAGEQRPVRRRAGWLLGAAALVAALAGASMLLLNPSAHHRSPADQQPAQEHPRSSTTLLTPGRTVAGVSNTDNRVTPGVTHPVRAARSGSAGHAGSAPAPRSAPAAGRPSTTSAAPGPSASSSATPPVTPTTSPPTSSTSSTSTTSVTATASASASPSPPVP